MPYILYFIFYFFEYLYKWKRGLGKLLSGRTSSGSSGSDTVARW